MVALSTYIYPRYCICVENKTNMVHITVPSDRRNNTNEISSVLSTLMDLIQ